MYFIVLESSRKIAKLIEENLIFGYIIEELVMKHIVYVHDTSTENIFTGGAKGIFTGGQTHRLYQGSVQNGPQYRRGCVSRL